MQASSLFMSANSSMSKPPRSSAPLKLKKDSSLPQEKKEVFDSLESWASQQLLPLLKPVEQCWQPQDFLPNSSILLDEFTDQVKALRDQTARLPDEYFVVLVGEMITEDGLPLYHSLLGSLDGLRDESGSSQSPWAIWSRSWSAEENRHGDLLRTYLYLSGRVDMRMIEKTMQYFIRNGTDLGLENNPYLGFVYTTFQERATAISHGNTARLAKEGGDPVLARICATIAADEKRHEAAYGRIVEKLLEVDPNGAMIAIEDVMHKGIKMPAHLMYDGQDSQLFHHWSQVGQRLGIYTANDYIGIVEFLIERWKLEKLEGLTSDEGKRAQDFVCGLAPRMRKILERTNRIEPLCTKFSWIFNKDISI